MVEERNELRSAEEIRRDIATKRESISETVDQLSDRVQRNLDWREQVAHHPYLALGGAVVVGVLVSGIIQHSPAPRERIKDALGETIEEFTDGLRHSSSSLFGKTTSSPVLRSAIAGILTKAVVQAIKTNAQNVTSRTNPPRRDNVT